ncbi:hypothetical protein Cylst_5339 [Cylindrospermum stagnale PCC 7417]|uniref:Uncharacterized protein n=1 Tax=Cylindrospermum stagnale PCC 7417 TaxID=56107 RepID=K9X5J3_9NOST|nr:hypothetical protein [Cylindrospermum stagnale]AFZ27364.1 hypothetical protein Cylst_5339 [Cylindrospermum stagnale PCC 7417]
MAKITISALHPADSETFIYDLKDIDSQSIFGGRDDVFSPALDFGAKFFEFVISIYAIDTISLLAKSFNTTK